MFRCSLQLRVASRRIVPFGHLAHPRKIHTSARTDGQSEALLYTHIFNATQDALVCFSSAEEAGAE